MRRLSVFNQVTLNGFFAGPNDDISWAHKHDPEWLEFVEENSKSGGTLVFGRITYDMMASYWPTPLALEQNPVVAAQMNSLQKVVFLRTLDSVSWAKYDVAERRLGHRGAQAEAGAGQRHGDPAAAA